MENARKIIEKLKEYKEKTNNNNKTDMLNTLFTLQKTFDDYIRDTRSLSYTNKELWIQKMCTAIITEACELNDATNWKWWKNNKNIDWYNVKEEIIDIWHFLISLTIKAGITPEILLDSYIDKNIENYSRQLGTSDRTGYQL